MSKLMKHILTIILNILYFIKYFGYLRDEDLITRWGKD
jgi:hypothetical protein